MHRYFVTRNKTRYLVRDTYQLTGNVAVGVRCQRPLLDGDAERNGASAFDAGCSSVVASLKTLSE